MQRMPMQRSVPAAPLPILFAKEPKTSDSKLLVAVVSLLTEAFRDFFDSFAGELAPAAKKIPRGRVHRTTIAPLHFCGFLAAAPLGVKNGREQRGLSGPFALLRVMEWTRPLPGKVSAS